MMNKWIFAAGVLSSITFGIHVFAGGSDVHEPLLATGLSALLKTYISMLWHGVTAVLLINSAALLVAAFHRHLERPIVWAVVLQYIAYGGLFFGYGLAYLGTAWTTPQWLGFLAISMLAMAGLRIGKHPSRRAERYELLQG
jgi:hypothetical protein